MCISLIQHMRFSSNVSICIISSVSFISWFISFFVHLHLNKCQVFAEVISLILLFLLKGEKGYNDCHVFVPVSFSSPFASLTVTFMETNKNKRKYISGPWNSSASDVNAGMWPWTHQWNLSAVIHGIEPTDLFRKNHKCGSTNTFLRRSAKCHILKNGSFFVISIVDIYEIRFHVHWSLCLSLLKMKET